MFACKDAKHENRAKKRNRTDKRKQKREEQKMLLRLLMQKHNPQCYDSAESSASDTSDDEQLVHIRQKQKQNKKHKTHIAASSSIVKDDGDSADSDSADDGVPTRQVFRDIVFVDSASEDSDASADNHSDADQDDEDSDDKGGDCSTVSTAMMTAALDALDDIRMVGESNVRLDRSFLPRTVVCLTAAAIAIVTIAKVDTTWRTSTAHAITHMKDVVCSLDELKLPSDADSEIHKAAIATILRFCVRIEVGSYDKWAVHASLMNILAPITKAAADSAVAAATSAAKQPVAK
jgi:hypothetical protein